MIGATVNVTLVVSPRSAIGMAEIAEVVLIRVLRLLAEVILLRGATVIATSNASTRSATGMAAIAAVVLKIVQ